MSLVKDTWSLTEIIVDVFHSSLGLFFLCKVSCFFFLSFIEIKFTYHKNSPISGEPANVRQYI